MTPQDGLADDDARAEGDPRRPADTAAPETDDAPSGDPAEASDDEWTEAENSRPTLPEETADGLDDMGEEVRHQAEDLPSDEMRRS